MKSLLRCALALSVLSVPAGLARAAMTMDEAAEKAMGMIEGMAAIMDKDQDACDKMAADMVKFQDDNAGLLKELQEIKAKRTEEQKKAFRVKYADRLKAAQQKMMAGGTKCAKNEKVKAAMERMQ